MIYEVYQAQTDLLAPLRAMAHLARSVLQAPCAGPLANSALGRLGAAAELFSQTRLTHDRPPFGIAGTRIGDEDIAVSEEIATETPFARLLHFRKAREMPQPRILLVAPIAGHFSTLLRDTVATLLPDHDVFITDWRNARDVPTAEGQFGFDDYIDHMITFMDFLGSGTHVMGVCQPCAALLAAVAVMAERDHRAQPSSMTLMAGPVDTRISPTKVNMLAREHSIGWFERNLISAVPARFPGAYRRVYPGFVQLMAFMSMNLSRHVRTHLDMFQDMANGNEAKVTQAREFYDEYFAVLDMPAEFYLETVQRVFQEYHLPRGVLKYRGDTVDPLAIRETALLTVEGERDDICAPGQTVAAHDLCESIKPFRKMQRLQPGVGHYGVFAGGRWRKQTYPVVRDFILANE
jgi:polyhydroxyalkanoate depolymerase